MKKILFIYFGEAIVIKKKKQPVSSVEELIFQPQLFQFLGKIVRELNYEIALTHVLEAETGGKKAKEVADFITRTFKSEGIMLPDWKEKYDLANSFVIASTDANGKLSQNSKCQFIRFNGKKGASSKQKAVFNANSWEEVYNFLKGTSRKIKHRRVTQETSIEVEINLDGTGKANISTGLNFFNHMLEQIAKHGGIDLKITAKGDLNIDEHHTIEDTAITLGEAFALALGDKRGIERYGFCLPMDDALAQVALDFGGRNQLVWEAVFKREKVGDVPTEMFIHFFKSFSDASKSNLNIKAEGENEHHKIEAIFKAFAKAIKMAVKRDLNNLQLPSTKGIL